MKNQNLSLEMDEINFGFESSCISSFNLDTFLNSSYILIKKKSATS